MILSLDTFENRLAAVNNASKIKPDHYVMNVHRSCAPAVGQIKEQIAKSTAGQLLNGVDLRTIFLPTGNPENWTLEGCSSAKSLAIVGASPTA